MSNKVLEPSELGELVRRAREERGWSRSRLSFELAVRHGVRFNEISLMNFENGKTQTIRNPKVLSALTDVLELPRDKVVSTLLGD